MSYQHHFTRKCNIMMNDEWWKLLEATTSLSGHGRMPTSSGCCGANELEFNCRNLNHNDDDDNPRHRWSITSFNGQHRVRSAGLGATTIMTMILIRQPIAALSRFALPWLMWPQSAMCGVLRHCVEPRNGLDRDGIAPRCLQNRRRRRRRVVQSTSISGLINFSGSPIVWPISHTYPDLSYANASASISHLELI